MLRARGALLAAGMILGCALAYLMEPGEAGAERATRMLVSIFSITGGVVLGTIVLLGDPAILLRGSARLVYWQIKDIRRRLGGLALLFGSYILTLAGIVVAAILSDISPTVAACLTRLSVALGVTALVYSLGAPFLSLRIQQARLDRELESRREADKQTSALRAV